MLTVSDNTQMKKSIACILYRQAELMSKQELQEVLFFEEETTNAWSIKKCQMQYVIDQLEWMEDNYVWEEECNEIWQEIKI